MPTPTAKAAKPAVMPDRVGAPTSASRLIGSPMGEYPSRRAPRIDHAAMKSTGPAIPAQLRQRANLCHVDIATIVEGVTRAGADGLSKHADAARPAPGP